MRTASKDSKLIMSNKKMHSNSPWPLPLAPQEQAQAGQPEWSSKGEATQAPIAQPKGKAAAKVASERSCSSQEIFR